MAWRFVWDNRTNPSYICHATVRWYLWVGLTCPTNNLERRNKNWPLVANKTCTVLFKTYHLILTLQRTPSNPLKHIKFLNIFIEFNKNTFKLQPHQIDANGYHPKTVRVFLGGSEFFHRQFFPTEFVHLRSKERLMLPPALGHTCPQRFDWKSWLLSWIYDRSIPHARVYGLFTYTLIRWKHGHMNKGKWQLGKNIPIPWSIWVCVPLFTVWVCCF